MNFRTNVSEVKLKEIGSYFSIAEDENISFIDTSRGVTIVDSIDSLKDLI